MKRVTVRIPVGLWNRLRTLSSDRDVSVEELVREVLHEAIANPDPNWQAKHDALLNEIGSRPRTGTWNREEIYAERFLALRGAGKQTFDAFGGGEKFLSDERSQFDQ